MPDGIHKNEIGLQHNNRFSLLFCFGFAYFTVPIKFFEITFDWLHWDLF